jgi:hypothetical protein
VTGAGKIRFSEGRLYVDRVAHADHFAGSDTVILLRQEADLLVPQILRLNLQPATYRVIVPFLQVRKRTVGAAGPG